MTTEVEDQRQARIQADLDKLYQLEALNEGMIRVEQGANDKLFLHILNIHNCPVRERGFICTRPNHRIQITFAQDYPISPPSLLIHSPVLVHPNVDVKGNVQMAEVANWEPGTSLCALVGKLWEIFTLQFVDYNHVLDSDAERLFRNPKNSAARSTAKLRMVEASAVAVPADGALSSEGAVSMTNGAAEAAFEADTAVAVVAEPVAEVLPEPSEEAAQVAAAEAASETGQQEASDPPPFEAAGEHVETIAAEAQVVGSEMPAAEPALVAGEGGITASMPEELVAQGEVELPAVEIAAPAEPLTNDEAAPSLAGEFIPVAEEQVGSAELQLAEVALPAWEEQEGDARAEEGVLSGSEDGPSVAHDADGAAVREVEQVGIGEAGDSSSSGGQAAAVLLAGGGGSQATGQPEKVARGRSQRQVKAPGATEKPATARRTGSQRKPSPGTEKPAAAPRTRTQGKASATTQRGTKRVANAPRKNNEGMQEQ